jgi:hypothetical protein
MTFGIALFLCRNGFGPPFSDKHPRLARRQRKAIADLPPGEIDAVDRLGVFMGQVHWGDLNSRRLRPAVRSCVTTAVVIMIRLGSHFASTPSLVVNLRFVRAMAVPV